MTTTEETNTPTSGNNESEQQAAPLTEITGYSMKKKQKNVPILEAVITKTSKGAYCAKGIDSDGNKMSVLMNKEKALAAIAAGLATKGFED